jgi:hypothetical protein
MIEKGIGICLIFMRINPNSERKVSDCHETKEIQPVHNLVHGLLKGKICYLGVSD